MATTRELYFPHPFLRGVGWFGVIGDFAHAFPLQRPDRISLSLCLLMGCAGYYLGPVNGAVANRKSGTFALKRFRGFVRYLIGRF
jgi:hypothetical protein